MKNLVFLIFSTITFYCHGQEKIILTTGDTLIGTVSKVDYDHSRITKPDGTSILILSNMIKKDKEVEVESYLDQEVIPKLLFGMHGGPAGAIVYGAVEQRKQYGFKFKPVQGLIAGVEIQYAIKPKFKIHVEVNYERKGYAQDVDILDQNYHPIAKTSVEFYYDYISLPVITKFIFSNNSKINFFVNTGIYAGYYFNFRWNLLATENTKGEKGSGTPSAKYNNLIDLGLVTGLGWNIPIKEHFQFSIEIRNNLGITGMYKDEIFSNRNIKHESLALLFGVAYKLK